MLKQLVGNKFTEVTGCQNDIEFWSQFSGITSDTAIDHMEAALSRSGYTGSPRNKLRLFLSDVANNRGTDYDNAMAWLSTPTRGLTFFKRFTSGLNANISVGSPLGTFTRTTDATHPACYTNSAGVIVAATNNQPRYVGGYYDTTGFHRASGLLIESSRTNILTYSNGTLYTAGSGIGWSGTKWDNWMALNSTLTGTATLENNLIPELTSIAGATSQRFFYTGISGDSGKKFDIRSPNTASGTVAQGDVVTLSFYARIRNPNTNGSGTFTISILDSSGAVLESSSAINKSSFTSSWARYSVSKTATDASASKCRLTFSTGALVDEGDINDFEIAFPQIEIAPYSSTYIPTTTSSLTRNADVLTYPTSGNRTASTETISVKFMPMGGDFANDSINRRLMATDTKDRMITKSPSGTRLTISPNNTDSSGSSALATTTPLKNVSYVFTGLMKHSLNYVEAYMDGALEGSDDTPDYTDPAWGTNFYIGSNAVGANQLNGLVFSISIHNRGLSLEEIVAEKNLL